MTAKEPRYATAVDTVLRALAPGAVVARAQIVESLNAELAVGPKRIGNQTRWTWKAKGKAGSSRGSKLGIKVGARLRALARAGAIERISDTEIKVIDMGRAPSLHAGPQMSPDHVGWPT